MSDNRAYRWKILIASYLASFAFGMTLQNVPPVMPLLIEDFGLAHAEAGLTMSLFALPMIFLSIPAGLLADRLGPKRVGLLAFVCTIVGSLVVAFSTSFPMLLAGRAIAGAGALTLVLIAPQFISQWFMARELGTAMGIWNTAFPLATIVSFVSLGGIGQALGWRASMLVALLAVIICMGVFWLLASPAPATGQRAERRGSLPQTIGRAGVTIWLVGAAWLLFNASTLSFMAFAQDYFQSAGYPVVMAGLLSSMMLWGTFVAAPLVGVLLDRGLRNELLMIIGSLGLAAALFLVPASPSLVVPILLFGALVSSLIVVSIFALPSTLLEPRLLGLGYGILATCLNVGTTLGPFLVGAVRDASGSYTPGFWAMSIMALLISVAALALFATRSTIPKARSVPE